MPLPWLLAIELSEFLKLRFCPLMIGACPLGNHLPSLRLAGKAPLLFFWRLTRPIAGVGVLKQPASLLIREGGALSLWLRLILEEEAAIRMGGSRTNQSEHSKRRRSQTQNGWSATGHPHGMPAEPLGKFEDNRT